MTNENLKHAEKLINELREEHGEDQRNSKVEEILEFLESAEDEIVDLKGEKEHLEEQLDELNKEDKGEDDDVTYDNNENLGLDTLNWSLDNGNLLIQQRMEDFIIQLKKEFGMLP